jgi:hypothetical protein
MDTFNLGYRDNCKAKFSDGTRLNNSVTLCSLSKRGQVKIEASHYLLN